MKGLRSQIGHFRSYPTSGSDLGPGGLSNAASSIKAMSSNPTSQYVTKTMSGAAIEAGRTYSVKVDFFNATGANISSSTCTLTAELEGSP